MESMIKHVFFLAFSLHLLPLSPSSYYFFSFTSSSTVLLTLNLSPTHDLLFLFLYHSSPSSPPLLVVSSRDYYELKLKEVFWKVETDTYL